METNDVLLWMVVIANATLVFQAVRVQGARSWLTTALGVLAVTGVAWVIWRGAAGYVGVAAWGVFFWVPLLGMRLVVWQGMSRRYGAAARTMGWVKWFRPVPESFAMARVFRAASWADAGEIGRAEGELVELSRLTGNAGMMAKMQLHRIRGDWEVLVQEMMRGGGINVGMTATYLRALGETGRVNEMVRMMAGTWPGLMRPQYAVVRASAMMVYLAFLGRVEEVGRIMEGRMKGLSGDSKKFWKATALLAAGRNEEANAVLLEMGDRGSVGERAGDRRGWVMRAEGILTEASRQFVGQLEREFAQEAMYSVQGGAMAKGRPWAVYGLIVANVAMFGVELAKGGAENTEALFQLGALYGPAVMEGEWWRVVTANFLHFGWLHIGMNMLALYALGRGMERRLGAVRFLVVYLASGIGALCGVVEIERWRQIEPGVLVGASACVMGLIGAMLGIIFVGWLRHRAKGASQQFKGLLWVVILQVCFDWSFPQVSSMAHMLGLGIGFVVTAVLVGMERGGRKQSL